MKILIVGNGGREFAIAKKIMEQNPETIIYFAEGNGATKSIGINTGISQTDTANLIKFVQDEKISFTIVGPELPLVDGIVDAFERANLKIFGPNKQGSKLEASKDFTKKILLDAKIPTAEYMTFTDAKLAIDYAKGLLEKNSAKKVVLKADGLASGKGVIIASTEREIEYSIKNVLENKIFGEQSLLVEEFLIGFETSLIFITDGKNYKKLPTARDHKTIYDAGQGPNTGGMGTYSPDYEADYYLKNIDEDIIVPLIDELNKNNILYKGAIFLGLMITNDGPKVLEINARFGDPETQAILPLIKSNFLDLLLKASDSKLNEYNLEIENKKTINLILASEGYPEKVVDNKLISGLQDLSNSEVIFAGVREEDGDYFSKGGRVLSLVIKGDDFYEMKKKVYDDMKKISLENSQYRNDISPVVTRVYVTKKDEFDVLSRSVYSKLKDELGIDVSGLKLYKRYDIEGLNKDEILSIKDNILSEPPVDKIYLFEDVYEIQNKIENPLVISYKSGQFDAREQGLKDTIFSVYPEKNVQIKVEEVISLPSINKDELQKIKSYLINPVDQEEGKFLGIPSTISKKSIKNDSVLIYDGFIDLDDDGLYKFYEENKLAMSLDDLKFVKEYFKSEKRNPTEVELSQIDTYWSDHCRHTTFNTILNDIKFEDVKTPRDEALKNTYEKYLNLRQQLELKKSISLMDIGTIYSKWMKKNGLLNDVEFSDEINACTLDIKAHIDGKNEDVLLLFKNETHNHPTEIEPFGGAQTCLGGAIRDPLSGRAYVYQAMRITGASDPINDYQIDGKLSQKKIIRDALKGYSSYGNQIGLATGYVEELFHPGYKAKRMEVGAVLGAQLKKNVKKEKPKKGDVIVLLGGKTGRDGVGGATGSSKSHNINSVSEASAEVQKGHAPTERKIQRLFRNPEASILIKKCNDFGAGGVSVAIGELAESLDIYLDRVPLKYEGLTAKEIAISESQERMAVVIDKNDIEKFMELAKEENLNATIVSEVTDTNRVRMFYNGKIVSDLSREFMDSTGAERYQSVFVESKKICNHEIDNREIDEYITEELSSLKHGSRKALLENFDFSVGRSTVTMPLGGSNELTPINAMICKLPSFTDNTKTVSYMSYGFEPYLSEEDPYIGSYRAVVFSILKLVSSGCPLNVIRLSFQEYFQKLGNDPKNWQLPFVALLGALEACMEFSIPPIGGKDSMSGTFENINVPPTLISFAVGYSDIERVITTELKGNHRLGYLEFPLKDNGLLDIDRALEIIQIIDKNISNKNIISQYLTENDSVLTALFKMSFGNCINFDINCDEYVLKEYRKVRVVIEYKEDFDGVNFIGYSGTSSTKINDKEIDYINQMNIFANAMNEVYGPSMNYGQSEVKYNNISTRKKKSSRCVDKVKVVIPVFEGTNSEYDSRRAFENEGAIVEEVLIKNIDSTLLEKSIDDFANAIKSAQILFIPGGFSMSDEPDGSAKFIATIIRHKKIRESIEYMLSEVGNDGLILGICNGFQALIKTGLLPYGKIKDLSDDDPTLTFNSCNKHIAKIIPTKVLTNNSPWLKYIDKDTVYNVPISHGEGRFVINETLYDELKQNDQIAFKYLVNPNGSYHSVESILDPSGKIFGKMGHSERVGDNLYKNHPNIKYQNIFKAGVDYFKK